MQVDKNVDFNKDIENYGIRDVSCKIHKFPGAKARQIEYYANINIQDDDTHGLIIVSGTNSLRSTLGKPDHTDEEVAHSILRTGLSARSQGVVKILVSGVITRRGMHYQRRISNINRILKDECCKQGFIFIDQTNISMEHLNSEDGLHLNFAGRKFLRIIF